MYDRGKTFTSYKIKGRPTLPPHSSHILKLYTLTHQLVRNIDNLYESFYIHKHFLLRLQDAMYPQDTIDSSEIVQQYTGINCDFFNDMRLTVTCPETSVVTKKNEAKLML